jgi:hypothetical protein
VRSPPKIEGHEQRVLVTVVGGTQAGLDEAQGTVEGASPDVTRAHLEVDAPRIGSSRVGEGGLDEGPGEALAAVLRTHRDRHYVRLVGDQLEADIAGDGAIYFEY